MRCWVYRKCWSDQLILRIAWATSRPFLVFSMTIFSSSEFRSNLSKTPYSIGAVSPGTIQLANSFWFEIRLAVLRRWTICFTPPFLPSESLWVRMASTRLGETGHYFLMNRAPSSAWVTPTVPASFSLSKIGRFYLFEKLGVFFRDQVIKNDNANIAHQTTMDY